MPTREVEDPGNQSDSLEACKGQDHGVGREERGETTLSVVNTAGSRDNYDFLTSDPSSQPRDL